MEEVMDFDEWYANYVPPEVQYVAVFDPLTGKVLTVGPAAAFESETNKVSIDNEVAERIINADIHIEHCLVDINSNELEIAEVKTLVKIDDVLHRIALAKYTTIRNPDIYLLYESKDKTLTVTLSEEFGGTQIPETPVKQRKIVWDGDTEMDFLITEYNDPNLIFEMFSVKINDLIGKPVVIENIDYEKFSVYTRRLFKKYVIEYR
jgi:hypothetical protein